MESRKKKQEKKHELSLYRRDAAGNVTEITRNHLDYNDVLQFYLREISNQMDVMSVSDASEYDSKKLLWDIFRKCEIVLENARSHSKYLGWIKLTIISLCHQFLSVADESGEKLLFEKAKNYIDKAIALCGKKLPQENSNEMELISNDNKHLLNINALTQITLKIYEFYMSCSSLYKLQFKKEKYKLQNSKPARQNRSASLKTHKNKMSSILSNEDLNKNRLMEYLKLHAQVNQSVFLMMLSDKKRAMMYALNTCRFFEIIYPDGMLKKIIEELLKLPTPLDEVGEVAVLLITLYGSALSVVTEQLKNTIYAHYPLATAKTDYAKYDHETLKTVKFLYETYLRVIENSIYIAENGCKVNKHVEKDLEETNEVQIQIHLYMLQCEAQLLREVLITFNEGLSLQLQKMTEHKKDIFQREFYKKTKIKKASYFQPRKNKDEQQEEHTDKTMFDTRINHAFQYIEKQEYESAITLYQKILTESDVHSLQYANILANMAEAYQVWANWERYNNGIKKTEHRLKNEAIKHYERALKIFDEHLIKDDIHEKGKIQNDLNSITDELKKLYGYFQVKNRSTKQIEQAEQTKETNLPVTKQKHDYLSFDVLEKIPGARFKKLVYAFPLPDWLKQLLKMLYERFGIFGYPVGGPVRNFLLNRPTSDWDIVFNAPLDVIQKILISENYTAELYGKHPVLRVSNGSEYAEFSTLMTYDYEKQNPQHKKQMCSITLDNGMNYYYLSAQDLLADCKGRDLTINTLFYNWLTHTVVDPTGFGLDDLEECSIRFVYSAIQSTKDDPIRILRAIRFSVKLNFTVEPEALLAMKANAHLLKEDNYAERVLREFDKMLKERKIMMCVTQLQNFEMLQIFFPDALVVLAQLKKTLNHFFILEYLMVASHENATDYNKDLMLFLSVMLWPNIGNLLTSFSKFKRTTENHQQLIKRLDETLDQYEFLLKGVPEARIKIKIILHLFITHHFPKCPDVFLTNTKYMTDDLMLKEKLIDLHTESAKKFHDSQVKLSQRNKNKKVHDDSPDHVPELNEMNFPNLL